MNTVENDLVAENAAMCRHDAKVDEFERRFDLLSRDLIKAANGYLSTPKALDVVEALAADLVDIYLEMER